MIFNVFGAKKEKEDHKQFMLNGKQVDLYAIEYSRHNPNRYRGSNNYDFEPRTQLFHQGTCSLFPGWKWEPEFMPREGVMYDVVVSGPEGKLEPDTPEFKIVGRILLAMMERQCHWRKGEDPDKLIAQFEDKD